MSSKSSSASPRPSVMSARASMISEEEVGELTQGRIQRNKFKLVGAMAAMAVGAFALGVVIQPALIPSQEAVAPTSTSPSDTSTESYSPEPVTLPAPFNGGSRSADDESVNAKRTEALHQMYQKYPTLGQITPEAMGELMDTYIAGRSLGGWEDASVPEEFMRLQYEIRMEEGEEEENDIRRLQQGLERPRWLTYDERLDEYRRLVENLSESDRFPQDLVKNAWAQCRSDFPDSVKYADDQVAIKREGDDCWIVADTSNSLEDWINNLDLGKEELLGARRVNMRAKECGCEKRRWWGWCKTYKTCATFRKHGKGYDGFSKPWNGMREGIYSQVQSKCSGASLYKFTGYSRGGAIAAVMAATLKRDGVIPAEKIKLITFGSPRALVDSASDEVHADYETWRMIFKKDPVPSLPYGWMGYKHYGTMICNECGYSEGRDRPNFSWLHNVLDHTKYDTWF